MNLNWINPAAAALVGVLSVSTAAAAQAERQETVRLTLADAVQRAVEHNPDLAIVRLDTEVEAERVNESLGAYAPVFSTTLGGSRNVTPPTNYLLGDTAIDVKDRFSSTGVRQRLPWGAGTWSVSWDTARTTSNSLINSFDPNLQSGIQVAFSQPLVKDRKNPTRTRTSTLSRNATVRARSCGSASRRFKRLRRSSRPTGPSRPRSPTSKNSSDRSSLTWSSPARTGSVSMPARFRPSTSCRRRPRLRNAARV